MDTAVPNYHLQRLLYKEIFTCDNEAKLPTCAACKQLGMDGLKSFSDDLAVHGTPYRELKFSAPTPDAEGESMPNVEDLTLK